MEGDHILDSIVDDPFKDFGRGLTQANSSSSTTRFRYHNLDNIKQVSRPVSGFPSMLDHMHKFIPSCRVWFNIWFGVGGP